MLCVGCVYSSLCRHRSPFLFPLAIRTRSTPSRHLPKRLRPSCRDEDEAAAKKKRYTGAIAILPYHTSHDVTAVDADQLPFLRGLLWVLLLI